MANLRELAAEALRQSSTFSLFTEFDEAVKQNGVVP